jgi:hypothetical protein
MQKRDETIARCRRLRGQIIDRQVFLVPLPTSFISDVPDLIEHGPAAGWTVRAEPVQPTTERPNV